MTTLAVDDLSLDVRWSARRKTLELVVERDGSVTARAPEGTDVVVIEAYVREKRAWLYRKLAEKSALHASVAAKEYVSGEGFAYLGRNYRLLLVDEQDIPLKLEGGRFKLRRADAGEGRRHFVEWYSRHARAWLLRRVRLYAPRLGVAPNGVEIRDLGHRWGSCSKSGTLNFHWATILLPASVIDYVLVHELGHLGEPHHTPAFWLKMERTMPDFQHRKRWLAEHGASYVDL
jgi:predicted metal-dependent hydrolase